MERETIEQIRTGGFAGFVILVLFVFAYVIVTNGSGCGSPPGYPTYSPGPCVWRAIVITWGGLILAIVSLIVGGIAQISLMRRG